MNCPFPRGDFQVQNAVSFPGWGPVFHKEASSKGPWGGEATRLILLVHGPLARFRRVQNRRRLAKHYTP